MRFIVFSLAAFLALAFGSGCGGESEGGFVAPTLPVSGKVTFKGQPLTEGSITFEPDDAGREAHGRIGPDGTFVLGTFSNEDGAIPGLHRIAVSADARAGKMAPPLKFRSPSASEVTVEVVEGQTEYTINLE